MMGRLLACSMAFLACQSLTSGTAEAQGMEAWGGNGAAAFVADMPSSKAQRAACDFKFGEASDLMRDRGGFSGVFGQAYGMAMLDGRFQIAAKKLSDPAFVEQFKQYGLSQPQPDETFRTSYDQAEAMRAAGDAEAAVRGAAAAQERAAAVFPDPHVARTAAHLLHAAILHDAGRHAEAEAVALAVTAGREESRRLSGSLQSMWSSQAEEAMMARAPQLGAESFTNMPVEFQARLRSMFESGSSDPNRPATMNFLTQVGGVCALLERPLLPGEQESLAQLYGRGDIPAAKRVVENLAQSYGQLLAELGYVSPTRTMVARTKSTATSQPHTQGDLAQLDLAKASFREILEAYPRFAEGPDTAAAQARAVKLAELDHGQSSVELAIALALSGQEADLRRALSILPPDSPKWLRGRLHGDLGSLLQRNAGGPMMMPANRDSMKAAMAEIAKMTGGWGPTAFPAMGGPQGGATESLREALDHLSAAIAWADSADDGFLALKWRRTLKNVVTALGEEPQDSLVAELMELDREMMDPRRAMTGGVPEDRARSYVERREMMIIAKKHPRYAEEQRRAELEHKRKTVHGGQIKWAEGAWRHPYARDYLDGRS